MSGRIFPSNSETLRSSADLACVGRYPRFDEAGAIHHVHNRGLNKRPVFEDDTTIRVFKCMLAMEVRQGLIQVMSYCFMITHFHLVLLSVGGGLSLAMQKLESKFTKWFNLRHGRDGPLFRGRFGSRRVKSEKYLRTLFRYIDANPVTAKIVKTAEDYPHGSASDYLFGSIPPWLSSDWVVKDLAYWTERGMTFRQAYLQAFGGLSPDESFLIEQRMKSKSVQPDPLDDLLAAAPIGLRERFSQLAKCADGGQAAIPVLGPMAVCRAIEEQEKRLGDLAVRFAKRSHSAWPLIRAGMFREFCAMDFAKIAEHCSCAVATAHRRYLSHCKARMRISEYADAFEATARNCLAISRDDRRENPA